MALAHDLASDAERMAQADVQPVRQHDQPRRNRLAVRQRELLPVGAGRDRRHLGVDEGRALRDRAADGVDQRVVEDPVLLIGPRSRPRGRSARPRFPRRAPRSAGPRRQGRSSAAGESARRRTSRSGNPADRPDAGRSGRHRCRRARAWRRRSSRRARRRRSRYRCAAWTVSLTRALPLHPKYLMNLEFGRPSSTLARISRRPGLRGLQRFAPLWLIGTMRRFRARFLQISLQRCADKSPNRIARPRMPDNTVTFVPGGRRAPSAPRVEDRTPTVSDISQRTARSMPGGAADRDLPSSVSPPLSAELHHAEPSPIDRDLALPLWRARRDRARVEGVRARAPTAPCSRLSIGSRPGSTTSARAPAPCRRSSSAATGMDSCSSSCSSRSRGTGRCAA